MEAAHWAGLDWFREFDDLDGDEMAIIVAHYRCHHQIESVLAWDAQKKQRRSRP
jgi:hypothetical protein